MKLKLLFFMGVLSVLCNTMNGQNTAPVFQVPPPNRTDCPGYVAANIEYRVTDANTPAPLLVVTASAVGPQAVNFNFTQDPTGILRAIDVIPVGPIIPGIVTITLTLSDVGVPLPNLSTTAVFTVNFEDITDPIISTTLPLPNVVENISATAGCKFTVPDYKGLISATDYCGGVTITQFPAAATELSVAHNDVVTITLTATDDYGNDVSTSFDVTLKDITNPTISTPADKNEDVSSVDCSFTIPDYTSLATTSDNCGTVTKTQSPAIGTVISGHNTTQLITLTADDGNGNTATSSFTITLKDVTNPTISSVSNFNENLSTTDCTFTIPDYTSLATASDNCGTATKTQSPAIGTVISGHNTTQLITLTADDGNGNTATSTFTITLKDVTNPTISSVANFNVDINATDCNFSIPDYTSLATASDNCGTATITQSPASGTLSNHNTTQVIMLTVNDGNGNSVSTAFTITLKDVTLPTISGIAAISQDNDPGLCGASITVSATATDNCTSPITASGVRDDLAALNALYPVGVTTITWTATDAAGNMRTETQTVTVTDNEDPVFASSFPDLTVNNDPGLCSYATSQLPVPSVSDNCTPFSGVVTVDPVIIPVSAGPDHLPSIVTWTATDNAGNKVTATQNVTVQDLELPVMRTKNRTLYFDANGQIVITADDIDDGSTDNSGTDCFTKYVVDNVLDCNEKGDNTVNLHGQDLWGNQHFQGATVRALDNTPPTFVDAVLPDLAFNTNSGCEWVGVLPIPATADNCSVKSVTYTASGAFVPGSTIVVTWTVTDTAETTLVGTIDGVSGPHPANTTTMTQNVTVTDVEKPVAIAKLGVVVTLDPSGDASITGFDIDNGSTDNCGIDSITVSPQDFDCTNVGANVVTLTVTDESGNVSTIDTVVTVQDTTAPTVITQAYTAQLGAAGTVTITAANVNNGSSDSCGIKTMTVSPSSFTCANVGSNTVTLTVTDNNNNVSTGTATVTVADTVSPTVITKPFTAQLDATGNVAITAADVDNGSNDSCGIKTITVSPSSFTCANAGANTVTLTVTDNNDNVSTGTAIVTVVDSVLPVVITKAITVQLDAAGSVSIVAADVNNGSTDNCAIATYTLSKSTFTCSDIGATTITLKATDTSGNVSLPVNAIVTVQDVTAPVVNTQNITVSLDASGNVSIVPSQINNVSTDNCSIASYALDKTTFNCSNVGANTVTLTVIDSNGNSNSATATVTVQDTVKPIVRTRNITVQLSSSGAVSIVTSDINNGSTDNCGIVTYALSKTSFDCSNVGSNTVTLTATDAAGNSESATATVTVQDKVLPVLNATVATVTRNSDANACGALITITAPTTSDNCTIGAAVGTRSDSLALTALYPVGTTTITWSLTDANGNIALPTTTTVNVTDANAPVVITKNITVSLDASGNVSIVPSQVNNVSTDNCGIASYSLDKTTFNCSNVGANTVTLTVIDSNGNSNSATATVTVQDLVKPIVRTRNITVQLSTSGLVSIITSDINNGSTDNCGIVTYVLSKTSFDCTNVGSNTVTLTATDAAGNSESATATVTVQDKVVPTVITKNITVQLNASGSVTIVAADVNNGSSDVCGAVTLAISKATFTCANVGANVITLTVTDVNGNINQGFATVTVVDSVIPAITTNGNKTANVDANSCSAVVLVSATATDNCSVGSPMGVRRDGKPLSAAYPVGTTFIDWDVKDVNGNAAITAVQTVIVTDNILPVIVTNGNKFVTNDLDRCGAQVAVSATATDNCSVGSPTGVRFFNGSSTSDGLPVTAPYAVGTTTITWNVTDINGNAAVAVVQTVTVRDLQIPVINGTVVSIDPNTNTTACAATVSITAPTASDNCTVGSPVGTRSDNLALTALYPLGTTTITWRVTDINGNAAIPTTTTVKVKDMVLPTVITQNIAVQLNVGGFVTIVPAQVNNGSTDNCGIASYSLDKVSFNCSNVGANTVTLTVIDIHGNVNFATATVTVSEPIIPIARTRNITVQLNAAGTVSILPSDINNGSTDNCSIASYTLSKSTFNCSNVGQNIITLTATDASGNNSVPVNATVIVQDKVAPVVVTQPYTAQLDVNGLATVTPANVNNGSTDACGIATFAISKSSFTCANVGENIVTLTVTDVNGNSAQGFATVNVVDSVKPVVVAKDIELVLDGASVSITPEDVFVSATDACGVDVHSYTLSRDTFTIVDVLNSPVTVTLSVTDVNGNVGTDTFLVTFPTLPTVANEVITPNGDGTNDTWVIDNITNHPKSIVRVYNGWGSLVFSAVNYQNDWDGKINGNDVTLPDGGSYYYQIDLEGNGTINNQGWLYITRQ